MEWLTVLLTMIGNIVVAVVAIIPTIITNRKKTQDSIKASNEATDKRIDKMQESFDSHVKDYEAAKATSQRYRILRFYDEVCEGRKHSESHFEDILDDIDAYETYCEHHKDFKNNRGHLAMQYIRDTYSRVKANGGFLTHE
jgi:ribosomal protein S15P/S13E